MSVILFFNSRNEKRTFPKIFGDTAIKGTTKSLSFSNSLHFHPSITQSIIPRFALFKKIHVYETHKRQPGANRSHV